MVQVHLGTETVDYFRNLESLNSKRQSTHPDEVAGALEIVGSPESGDAVVKVVDVRKGERTSSEPPKGAITFHTHNVAPGTTYSKNMSTDVPSWQDFQVIALSTVEGTLKEHLVFTPTYSYVISVGSQLLDQLKKQKALSQNSLEAFVQGKTQSTYNALVNRDGENFGGAFVADWINAMKNVGFVIEQRHAGQDLTFEYAAPLTRAEAETHIKPGGGEGILASLPWGRTTSIAILIVIASVLIAGVMLALAKPAS